MQIKKDMDLVKFDEEVENYFFTCPDLTFEQAYDSVEPHQDLIVEMYQNGHSISDTIRAIINLNK